MTETVARHYEELLAEHYVWMLGVSFDAKIVEQKVLLESVGIAAGDYGTAIDLGSGPGFQTLALAALGYSRIVSVDTSQALLDQLDMRKTGLPIETVRSDIRDLARLVAPHTATLIVCMGDTLTHLESHADVSRLLGDAFAALAAGGLLVLTFRDLSMELTGLDRFLPIRADGDRNMICALDYEAETVTVTDLIHVREGESWFLRKSSYRKLRLSPATVADELRLHGFKVLRNEPAGRLQMIVALK